MIWSREISSGDRHREINLLLPWYVNGTLQRKQNKQVERHLALCSPCRKEVETLKGLSSAVILANEELPSPSARSLEQIFARIETEEKQKNVERAFWWKELWERITSYGLRPRLRVFRLAPAIAGLLIVVQFVTIVGLLSRDYWSLETHHTLSGPPEAGPAQGPRLLMVFQEGVSESSMRKALLSLHGNIVKGPAADGVYTVEIRRPMNSDEELEKTIEQLRTNTRVVKFVERAY